MTKYTLSCKNCNETFYSGHNQNKYCNACKFVVCKCNLCSLDIKIFRDKYKADKSYYCEPCREIDIKNAKCLIPNCGNKPKFYTHKIGSKSL